jgi:hypothetical protein
MLIKNLVGTGSSIGHPDFSMPMPGSGLGRCNDTVPYLPQTKTYIDILAVYEEALIQGPAFIKSTHTKKSTSAVDIVGVQRCRQAHNPPLAPIIRPNFPIATYRKSHTFDKISIMRLEEDRTDSPNTRVFDYFAKEHIQAIGSEQNIQSKE